MADYKVTDTQLTSIANAIRSKGGTSAPLAFPSAFISAINAIPQGGSGATLVSKTITANGTYDPTDDSADGYSEVTVNVPSGGITPTGEISIFANGSYDVTSYASAIVDVPSGGGGDADEVLGIVTGNISGSIYNSTFSIVDTFAFVSNRKLTKITMTSVQAIYGNAFQNCPALSQVNFPNCSSIDVRAFAECSTLSQLSFPNCSTIGAYAFQYCRALTEAIFPNCSTIGNSAFQHCSALSQVSFPNCSSIGTYAFYGCRSALRQVNFPNCSTIGSNAFQECRVLTEAIFPNCSTISNYAFAACSVLSQVYFLGSSVIKLNNSNAFDTTPMRNSTYLGYFGSIYVPASLYADYIVASNWSVYSERIVGLTAEEIAAL